MKTALHLSLIFFLTLTGIGLGAARGTVQLGGQVVICTGEGVVVRNILGAPSRIKAHICPDMALSFFDHAKGSAEMPKPEFRAKQFTLIFTEISWLSQSTPTASARDPPGIWA